MKKFLLIIASIVVGIVYLIIANTYNQNSNLEKLDEQQNQTLTTTTALQVSGLDVSTLESISDELQNTCAKNKYELTEAECVQAIKDHKDTCMRLISEKFPGQLADNERRQMIVANYVDCLFQQ